VTVGAKTGFIAERDTTNITIRFRKKADLPLTILAPSCTRVSTPAACWWK
jgi:hypothetical protein